MGLIYKGNGNQEFLEKWLERVMINLDGTSIGTYNIENEEEILNALINCQLYSEGERKSNTDKILDELKKDMSTMEIQRKHYIYIKEMNGEILCSKQLF